MRAAFLITDNSNSTDTVQQCTAIQNKKGVSSYKRFLSMYYPRMQRVESSVLRRILRRLI